MTSDEKRIEKKLRAAIEKLGGLCLKFPATHFTGIPDRICLLPGALMFFVELKGAGKTLSPRQIYVAKQLERLGFKCYVANTDPMVDNLIEAVKKVYTNETL
jgi:hypothetical protein